MSGSYLCIPRNETVIFKTVLSPSSFTHISVRFQDRSAYFAAGKYVDWSWEYINRSQTHECGIWDWGRAIPRKGIYIYGIFLAVHVLIHIHPSLPPSVIWNTFRTKYNHNLVLFLRWQNYPTKGLLSFFLTFISPRGRTCIFKFLYEEN